MSIKTPLLFMALAGSLCCTEMLRADLTTGIPIVVDVGSTNNPYVSYFVVDDTSLGNSAIEYAWYYSSTTESGTTNPLTGDDLVNAVVAGTADTQYALTPITEGGGGVDAGVDGFQIGSQTSVIVSPYDSTATNYWIYWINGGSQTTSYPPITTVTPTNWILAPDTPFDRFLTNGSSDGWTLDPWDGSSYTLTGAPPLSAAAVPEPSTVSFLLLSLAAFLAMIRWNFSRRNSKP